MTEFHKIQTLYKRNPETKNRTLLEGEYSLPEFEYLAQNQWRFDEKIDGTNIRIQIADGKVTFGGKTDAAQIPATLVTHLNAHFLPQTEALNAQFPDGACLYGEGYGAKIQKGGGNYRPDQGFCLFDVLVGSWWLQRDAIEEIAEQFGLQIAPIVGVGTLPQMVELAREGFNSAWGPFLAEGIVARPSVELKTRSGDRIITKIKHRDFAGAPRD